MPARRNDDIHALIAEYNAGSSTLELAERYGCSRAHIARLLRDHVTFRRQRGRRPAKGTPTETLVAEYNAGATTFELGAKYNLNPSGIGRRLRRAGVQMRIGHPNNNNCSDAHSARAASSQWGELQDAR